MRVLQTSVTLLLTAALCAPTLAAAQASVAPVPQAANARDALLITSVEQAYAAGLAAYQAGQAEEARKDFDRSVDLLLQSGVDIKNTPALLFFIDRVFY